MSVIPAPDINIPVITRDIFSEEVLKLIDKGFEPIDAILYFCTHNDIEIEIGAKLINKKVKALVENQARSLNFLPKQAELPFGDE